MIQRYRTFLVDNESKITLANVRDYFYQPLQHQQYAIADRLTHDVCALSYEDFLTRGDQLEPSSRKRIAKAVERLHIPEQLILVGWVADRFLLFKVDQEFLVQCDAFAAIGAGWAMAEAMLAARDKSAIRRLPTMAYRVYEAQRMGGLIPGVSSQRGQLMLVRHCGETTQVRQYRGGDAFEELWARFGLRELVEDFRL